MATTGDGGLIDVKKVIEKSTSKVTLRELEKRGFNKVKVLKSNDIHKLIRQAVETVLANRSKLSEEEKEAYIEKSREEFDRLMSQNKRQLDLQTQYEERFNELESQALEAQKALSERDRQMREVSQRYEKRIEELVDRLHQRGTETADRSEVEALRKKVQEAETAVQQNAEMRRYCEEAQHRLRLAEAEKNQTRQEFERAVAEVNALRGRLQEGQRGLNETTGRLSSLQTQAANFQHELMTAQSEKRMLATVEIPKLEGRIQELTEERKELIQRRRELEQRVATLETQLRAMGDLPAIKADLEQKSSALAKAQAMAELLEKRLETVTNELNDARTRAIEANPQIHHLQQQLEDMREKEERTQSRFDELFVRLSQEIQKNVQASPQSAAPAADFSSALDKMAEKITSSLNRRMVDAEGNVADAEKMAEVSLAALFASEDLGVQQTNIQELDLKAKKSSGVKGNLAKLKNMRKGESQ